MLDKIGLKTLRRDIRIETYQQGNVTMIPCLLIIISDLENITIVIDKLKCEFLIFFVFVSISKTIDCSRCNGT